MHGVWGRAEKTPDNLIWCSLQNHANMLIRDYHAIRPGVPAKSGYDRSASITEDCYAVCYADLEALNSDIRSLAEAAQQFHVHLRYKESPVGRNALQAFSSNRIVVDELAKDGQREA